MVDIVCLITANYKRIYFRPGGLRVRVQCCLARPGLCREAREDPGGQSAGLGWLGLVSARPHIDIDTRTLGSSQLVITCQGVGGE